MCWGMGIQQPAAASRAGGRGEGGVGVHCRQIARRGLAAERANGTLPDGRSSLGGVDVEK